MLPSHVSAVLQDTHCHKSCTFNSFILSRLSFVMRICQNSFCHRGDLQPHSLNQNFSNIRIYYWCYVRVLLSVRILAHLIRSSQLSCTITVRQISSATSRTEVFTGVCSSDMWTSFVFNMAVPQPGLLFQLSPVLSFSAIVERLILKKKFPEKTSDRFLWTLEWWIRKPPWDAPIF